MFYIIEIQKMFDGAFAHLVHTAELRNQAESKYYQVLAAAAISGLPLHSAALLTEDGKLLMSRCYRKNAAPAAE